MRRWRYEGSSWKLRSIFISIVMQRSARSEITAQGPGTEDPKTRTNTKQICKSYLTYVGAWATAAQTKTPPLEAISKAEGMELEWSLNGARMEPRDSTSQKDALPKEITPC